jgi:serine protease
MKLRFGFSVGVLALVTVIAGCGGGSSDRSLSGCLGQTAFAIGSGVEPSAVSVSGVIEIESQTRVDSDTSDDLRLNQAVSNNCDTEAQPLPVTGVAGGYVSATSGIYPDTGQQLDFAQDVQDYYTAQLKAGDRVSLQVFQTGDVEPGRARLQIFDPSDRQVFDSQSGFTSEPPFLHSIAMGQGEFTIRVSSVSGGPMRYVLIAAAEGTASMMNTAYADPGFVPGEAVVTLRGTGPEPAGEQLVTSLAADGAVALGSGAWKLAMNLPGAAAPLNQQAQAWQRTETLSWIKTLREHPDVASVSPNYHIHAQTLSPESNPLYSRQWNLPLINLPIAWQAAPNFGRGVGVAVMDTGLFSATPNSYGNWHPDLNANVVPASVDLLDYVSGELDIDNQQGRDTNPADPGDGQARSSNFHGSHVAGIVSAVDNSAGIVGVANASTLIPVRVLGRQGSGNLSDLIAAVSWAGQADSGVDVINLSLGGVGPDVALENAINDAFSRGKLIVAAAGNAATDEPTYPAAFDNVVGVGAVDAGGTRASYSNFGVSVDLVAPGGDASRDANLDGAADVITSAWGTDDGGVFEPGYAGLQGTSMAAPHVAGVYALMKGEESTLTPGQFFALLADGQLTDTVGSATEYGAGLINAIKAVDAARSGNIPDVLAVSPSVLSFSQATLSQTLSFVRYPSSAEITIQSVVVGDDWLQIDPAISGGAPPSSVTVTVDASQLDSSQIYSSEILITYNGGRKLEIPVNVRLVDPTDERNAGRHYVLLVTSDGNYDTVAQSVVSATGGQYRFQFGAVDPGDYFLVAGTDTDNNGFICESGEACAEYPVNGLPQPISVGLDPINGIALSTSFRRPTISALGAPRVDFQGYRLNRDGPTAKKVQVQ